MKKHLNFDDYNEIANNYYNGNRTTFFKDIAKMSKFQLLMFLNQCQHEFDFLSVIIRHQIELG